MHNGIMTTRKQEAQSRYTDDCVCPMCHGTGRRGRGKCRACHGKGTQDLGHPRIQFNHGYHDAAMDAKEGRARRLVEQGGQSVKQVSFQFNWWYALGYETGLSDAKDGIYEHSSSPAWTRTTDLPDTW